MAATQVAAPEPTESAHGRTFSLTPGGGLRGRARGGHRGLPADLRRPDDNRRDTVEGRHCGRHHSCAVRRREQAVRPRLPEVGGLLSPRPASASGSSCSSCSMATVRFVTRPAGRWLWGLIGGRRLGRPAWSSSRGRRPSGRRSCPMAVVAFAGLGVLLGGGDERRPPPRSTGARSWCLPPSASRSRGLAGVHARGRRDPKVLLHAALDGRRRRRGVRQVGGADSHCRRDRHGVPGRTSGRIAGRRRRPPHAARDPGGPAQPLRPRRGVVRSRQRSREWIFLGPAMLVRRRRPGRVPDPDGLLSFTTRQHRVRRDRQLPQVVEEQRVLHRENWEWSKILGLRLFWIAAVALLIGVVVGVVAGRPTDQRSRRDRRRLRPCSSPFFLASCSCSSPCGARCSTTSGG